MLVIKRKSALWRYLPGEIKGLVTDGEELLSHAKDHQTKISDYSYLVFPFSKAYEGFLKRFFLDMDLIAEDEYYSDDIRIGRILNPHFTKDKKNVFNRLCDNPKTSKKEGRDVAEKLWRIWKRGRNLVFHYFPHNFRRLDYDAALDIINSLIDAMETAVVGCKLDVSKVSKHEKVKSIT